MQARNSSFFFDPKRVGESLSEVAVELINVENQEIQSRWFHSEHETDLFIWSDVDGRIIKQQLSFYGQIVEWNFVDGTKTGYIMESEGGAADIKASETVHFDLQPQLATITMSIQILKFVKMDEVLKTTLVAHLTEKPLGKKRDQKTSKFAAILNRFRK